MNLRDFFDIAGGIAVAVFAVHVWNACTCIIKDYKKRHQSNGVDYPSYPS
jgi:succinate dehydrogenase hydrophobic anchor subunit